MHKQKETKNLIFGDKSTKSEYTVLKPQLLADSIALFTIAYGIDHSMIMYTQTIIDGSNILFGKQNIRCFVCLSR